VSPNSAPTDPGHRLILASKSRARAAVLRGAGLQFEQIGSGVDEEALKDALRAEGASVAMGDLFADSMAENVIDGFEAVEVEENHGGFTVILQHAR
jgi:predicted house-cleaning NTP pyrophosphatase (Maf/HAM1 superfamily)